MAPCIDDQSASSLTARELFNSTSKTISVQLIHQMAAADFDALRDLHDSANDMLHSPVMKRAIVHLRQEKLVDEISETSLRMLDACGTTKDVLLLVKDHLQGLHSTFRKASLGESSAADGNRFAAYSHERKKLKKEMFKRLHSLKAMKNKCITSDVSPGDQNLMVVVNVLREVRVTTMAIVESLMSLMAMPCPRRKVNKGLFAAKLMRVDSLSLWEKCDTMALQSANKRLEAVETAIEELEVKLECMFRRLIRTRVSLLNILTT